MTFSIVIPTYNGERFIEQTLTSAICQNRLPDEIIVSDDNSTDGTLKICEKYIGKIRIYTNTKGPSGFVRGWNNAIAKATGEYICILHQDDLLAPTFLKEAEKSLRKYPEIKHFFVPCNYIDENNNIIWEPDYCDGEAHIYSGLEYVNAYQMLGSPHIHRCPGVITHREIFNVCQYRTEAGHIADDDFFYRVGQYTNVLGLLRPLASFRMHEKSETGHLEDTILVKRLIHDYQYQLHQYPHNVLFNMSHYHFFRAQKKKFIRRLIAYGIKKCNVNWILYSLKYALY